MRLLSRRGPLIRRDRIEYAEIADVEGAIAALRDAGFLSSRPDDRRSLIRLALKAELLTLARELGFGGLSRARRSDLVEMLHAVPAGIVELGLQRRFEIVRPLHRTEVDTLRLLFFGNFHQDWTEFVLRDLAVARYESYELGGELRRFRDRRCLDDALRARAAQLEIHDLIARRDLDQALSVARSLAGRDWGEVAKATIDRILYEVGHRLEQTRRLEEALEIYSCARRPPARERRCRVLAKLGLAKKAIDACTEIERDPLDEQERLFAPRFARRILRRQGLLGPEARHRRRQRRMTLPGEAGDAVEEAVIAALAGQGVRSLHSENWLWLSLFGLAFWDIVFAPISGAFEQPFQSGPLDLRGPGFRRRRSDQIETRLAEIREGLWPKSRMLQRFDEKRGLRNPFVSWSKGSRSLLDLVLDHLGTKSMAEVFDRLSREPGRYRRGLPDLFVVRPETETGFGLYEVKAPGDQLRPEQGAWLDYLNAAGIPATILRVQWAQGARPLC